MSFEYDVFLSHSTQDKPRVRLLAERLTDVGIRVWLDAWELRVGDSLIGMIEKGIGESQWMVVILSDAALKSEWVIKELRTGLTREIGERKVFVLPVLIEKVTLPAFLSDKFYADFSDSYENGLRLILDRLIGEYNTTSHKYWLTIENPSSNLAIPLASQVVVPLSRDIFHCLQLGYPDAKEKDDAMSRQLIELSERVAETLEGKADTDSPTEAPMSRELWFGRTGRLILRAQGTKIFGDYDWHGLSLVGKIYGDRMGELLRFAWKWAQSTEGGKGIFWTTVPNVLYGGWWPDYDDVDEAAILKRIIQPPNLWEFVNVQGLRIVSR